MWPFFIMYLACVQILRNVIVGTGPTVWLRCTLAMLLVIPSSYLATTPNPLILSFGAWFALTSRASIFGPISEIVSPRVLVIRPGGSGPGDEADLLLSSWNSCRSCRSCEPADPFDVTYGGVKPEVYDACSR